MPKMPLKANVATASPIAINDYVMRNDYRKMLVYKLNENEILVFNVYSFINFHLVMGQFRFLILSKRIGIENHWPPNVDFQILSWVGSTALIVIDFRMFRVAIVIYLRQLPQTGVSSTYIAIEFLICLPYLPFKNSNYFATYWFCYILISVSLQIAVKLLSLSLTILGDKIRLLFFLIST